MTGKFPPKVVKRIRSAKVPGAALCAALAALPVPALAETRFTTTVSAGGGVETNPYLNAAGDQEFPSINVSLRPSLSITDPTSEIVLNGFASYDEYFDRLPSAESFSLDAAVTKQTSARLRLRFGAGLSSTVNAAGRLAAGSIANPVRPSPDDITLNNLRLRSNRFQSSAGLTYALSPIEDLSVDVQLALTRLPNSTLNLNEFDFGQIRAGYQRAVSDRFRLGAELGVSRSDLLGTTIGDATTLAPQLTFVAELSPTWTLSGGAGVNIARITQVLGDDTVTNLSGNLSACRRGRGNSLCLEASQATLPTALNGVSNQSSVRLSYNLDFSQFTKASFAASYSRTSQGALVQNGLGGQDTFEFVSANATVEQEFNDRLLGFFALGFADNYGNLSIGRPNWQMNVGVRVLLGDRR